MYCALAANNSPTIPAVIVLVIGSTTSPPTGKDTNNSKPLGKNPGAVVDGRLLYVENIPTELSVIPVNSKHGQEKLVPLY